MNKFNLDTIGLGNGMLNKKSQELKEGLEIINIPISKIKENEKNTYSIDGIEELVDSIRAVGLKQNLDVMKLPDGTYKVLTGHRRLKALQILSKEDDKYSIVPCSVTDVEQVNLPISEESKEMYLIHITNATQRNMTEADKYTQYKDLVSIYQEAKKNGFALSEKMRNLIANDMKISPAQVGKMDYIRNNGTSELEQRILNNEISIASASEIAHHDKSLQGTLKAKKQRTRIIDTLTKDSYHLDSTLINPLTKQYASLTQIYQQAAGREIDKKKYAKLLESKEKIEKELENIKNIINSQK